MKKLITLLTLLITNSIVCLFAQNSEYDSLMQKAKEYETQKKYVYAMGTYWDAILASDNYDESSDAYSKYIDLFAAFKSGKPGLDEYDEFSIYDEWNKAWDEWILYQADSPMFYISFDQLKKGELDYETKTASYKITAHYKESDKIQIIENALSVGWNKAKQSNWKDIIFPEKYKEFAKQKKAFFFYQDKQTGDYTNNIVTGYSWKARMLVYNGTESYTELVSTDGGPIRYGPDGAVNAKKVTKTRKLSGSYPLMTIDFDVLDNDGNVLLQSINSYCGFTLRFDKVPQDVMKIIDSGEYKIKPVRLKIKYGYLSEDPSQKEIDALAEKIIDVPTIETIRDINLNKFYDKQKEIIAEAKNRNASNSINTENLIESVTLPFPESCYDILITGSKCIPNLKVTNELEYCNELSKLLGLEPYYKNINKKSEVNSKANGFRVIECFGLYESGYYYNEIDGKKFESIISETKNGSKYCVVRPHNPQKSKVGFEERKKIFSEMQDKIAEEEKKRIEKENIENNLANGIVVIPEGVEEITEYYVTHDIHDKNKVVSVVIPSTAKKITEYAFKNCSSLKSVIIPEGVKTIEEGAFYKCSSLESVKLPLSITTIGNAAFYECKALNNIELPENLKTIGESAFAKCSSLKSVRISDTVKTIGKGAFSECTSLESINIPKSITTIGERAFWVCESLKSIVIPQSVDSIGNSVFYGCKSLKTVNISGNIKSITDELFYGCESLENITLPESITRIGKSAFYCCTSLNKISLPYNVKIIDDSSFAGCTALKVIVIPENVSTIGNWAFATSGLESLNIPKSVSMIKDEAFAHNTNLKTVLISEGITGIGKTVFLDCPCLNSIEIPKKLKNKKELKDFINTYNKILKYY